MELCRLPLRSCRTDTALGRSGRRRGQPGESVALVAGEFPAHDRLARACHEPDQEAQVVQAQQAQAEQLLLVDQVAQVGAAEAAAGRTVATLLQRTLVAGEAGVTEIDPSLPG